MRLYAEDVAAGHLPTSGRLDRLYVHAQDGVRVDSGYADGSVVPTFYDAMLAKVIAWGPSRPIAVERLSDALEHAEVHGLLTNLDQLIKVIRHPAFHAGETDTEFLDRHAADVGGTSAPDPETRRLHTMAAMVAARADRANSSPLPAGIPGGWRNVGPAVQLVVFDFADGPVTASLTSTRSGLRGTVNGVSMDIVVHDVSGNMIDLEVDRHRVTCRVQRAGIGEDGSARVHVDSPLGSTTSRERLRFAIPHRADPAGSLLSPMPGTVAGVAAVAGTVIEAGTPLVTLEAMKMEHTLRAPHAGMVREVRVAVGAQVDAGTVLVVVSEEP